PHRPRKGASSATTKSAPLGTWPGFVHGECSPVELLAVEGGNGRLSFVIIVHLDKAKAFRAAGIPVHDDLRRLNRAMRSKQSLQIAVRRVIGQVANVQFLGHAWPPFKKKADVLECPAAFHHVGLLVNGSP